MTGTRSENAHQSVITAARRCIVRAIRSPVAHATTPEELILSDEVYRRLSGCVHEYASVLKSLGESDGAVVSMVMKSVREAAEPDAPPAALVGAVEAWCREAGEGGSGKGDAGTTQP